MRGQSSEATCGSTALYNALAAWGEPRSLEECEKLCKTSMTNGTSVRNLLAAVRAISTPNEPQVILEGRREIAWLLIRQSITAGRPVITLVSSNEPDDHYVAVVGTIGHDLLIADSANIELVEPFGFEGMCERWKAKKVWGVAL